MSIYFFISACGMFLSLLLYRESTEPIKSQLNDDKQEEVRIREILSFVSGWIFFLFWIRVWILPQPRFTISLFQNFPMPVMAQTPILHLIIGMPFLIAGGWIGIKAVKQLTLRVSEYHNPKEVMTQGLYSVIRHPQYMGGLLAHFGISFILSAKLSLFFTPAMVGVIYLMSRKEEKELIKGFGEVYQDYQKRVPMLIPMSFHCLIFKPNNDKEDESCV